MNRLNGLASGSTSKEEGVPWERKGAVPRPAASGTRQATLAERKQQLAQLAEMGVAVPDDFRKEMAMVGDWQTTSQRLIYDRDPVKKEEDVGVKPESMSVGVRKRKFEGQVEEEETGVTVSRKGWGSTIKTYPGAGEEDDLDALLKKMRNAKGDDEDSGMQNMSTLSGSADGLSAPDKGPPPDKPPIKREESKEIGALSSGVKVVSIKQEEDMADPGLMFKKRKAKPIRQR